MSQMCAMWHGTFLLFPFLDKKEWENYFLRSNLKWISLLCVEEPGEYRYEIVMVYFFSVILLLRASRNLSISTLCIFVAISMLATRPIVFLITGFAI